MPMTVKELIDELQNYEQDKTVWICVNDNYTLVKNVDMEEIVGDDDVVLR